MQQDVVYDIINHGLEALHLENRTNIILSQVLNIKDEVANYYDLNNKDSPIYWRMLWYEIKKIYKVFNYVSATCIWQ